MDKQSMPMPGMDNMHNTLWREEQIVLTFHSSTQLITTDGVNNGGAILQQLKLEEQLAKLNRFLQGHDIDYTISFFDSDDTTDGPSPSQQGAFTNEQRDNGFNPPPGIYLFDVSSSQIEPTFGLVATSIVGCFNFKSNAFKAVTGQEGPIVRAVNLINGSLGELNRDMQLQIPISAACPGWLSGGTPTVTQGCPLTPPISVDDACSLWRVTFPKMLSPKLLQSMTGEGVTVFILDTLPEGEVIAQAAEEAGDDNLLLVDVNNNVTFNYHIKTPIIMGSNSEPVSVGKDVYGKHFAMEMPDHGLFIAGIVRDIAPKARVECIRVLNKYCVGDTHMLTRALYYIAKRLSRGGDLFQRPVVINMSLVIPTKEEAKSKGLDPDLGGPDNDAFTDLRQQIQCLVGLGAILVASAGNEGDLRENPSGNRPSALYPAAFANPPYSINGIIPVGAVDSNGNAASYSCYPGPRGVATYGGNIPSVIPKDPPDADSTVPITVTITDAMRGIYSSPVYPPLVADHLAASEAPNDHAWAYWVGTSFATPIISAIAARVLEWKSKGAVIPNVHDVIIAAGANATRWDRLDPVTAGSASGSVDGPVILAVQECGAVDEDDEEIDIEIAVVIGEEPEA